MSPYREIINLLKKTNTKYEEITHEPVYTAEQAAKVRGISLDAGAKSLLLKTGEGFILAVLPGSRKMDSKELKSYLKEDSLRFATPTEVEEVMGCQIGSCYPFGNLINLRTIVDEKLSREEVISFNPGVHTKSIKIAWADYQGLVQPEITSFSD